MDLLTFLKFNRRVRGTLFDTLASMPAEDFLADVGISFGSLRNTLFHVMRVEDFWVNDFLRGGASIVSREERESLETVADLAARWDRVSDETETYIAGLTDEELTERRDRSLGEEVVQKTVEDYLHTFLIHEVYHKGEVLAVLWQKGFEELPPVDFWRY